MQNQINKLSLEDKIKLINKHKIPRHVAIIMDGNGRWAKEKGYPRIFGHQEGAKRVEDILKIAKRVGISYISFFSFSTENWNRPKEEVEFLFTLMANYLEDKKNMLLKNKIRFKAIGRIYELPSFLQKKIKEVEEETKDFKDLTAVFCINYGGRQEILDAVNKIAYDIRNNILEDKYICENVFKKYLYLPELPDVDLLIRTSGEKRISNFLLWFIPYAELYFTKKYWPDFKEEDFIDAILDFQNRQRRFGGI